MSRELCAKSLWIQSWLFCVVLGVLFSVVPVGGSAQELYPTRPIIAVVTFGTGGVADLGSRVMAEKMSEFLGQRMVTIYKPGGAGALGVSWVSKTKPDGYTVLVALSGPLVFTPLIRKTDYSLDDFILTGAYGQVPSWVLVRADSRWKTLKDFVDDARKSPGKLTIASFGKMTTGDFGIQLWEKFAGIRLTQVPYASTGETMAAVLGGNADAAWAVGAGGQLTSGSLRILAVAEKERLKQFPDVPTLSEFGYPVVIPAWHAFAVPKGTPRYVLERLYAAQEYAFRKRSAEGDLLKVEVMGKLLDPDQANRAFRELQTLYGDMVKEFGVLAK